MEALDDINEDGWDDDDGEVIFDDLGPTTNAIDVPSLSTAPVAVLSTVTIDVSTETDVKLFDTPLGVNTPNLTLDTFNHTKVTTTPVVTDIPADTGLEDDMVDLDVKGTNIDDFGDDNDLDFDDDDDDADIADLENFLSKSLK